MRKLKGSTFRADTHEECELLWSYKAWKILAKTSTTDLMDLYAELVLHGPRLGGKLNFFLVKQEVSSRTHGYSIAAINCDIVKSKILNMVK